MLKRNGVFLSQFSNFRWKLMEEERKINRLLRDDPENEKLNDRLQQVAIMMDVEYERGDWRLVWMLVRGSSCHVLVARRPRSSLVPPSAGIRQTLLREIDACACFV